jgi:hypothetical protein
MLNYMIMISLDEVVSYNKLISLPPGIFPELESIFPKDCRDDEKMRMVVALLQIALRHEDDL